MKNLNAIHELGIINTSFDHKPKYKSTPMNIREQKTIIDYTITNRHLHPSQILDVRTFSSTTVGSDHKQVIGKFEMSLKPKIKTISIISEENLQETYMRID